MGDSSAESVKPSWAWDRPCADTDCDAVGEHWHDGYRYWGERKK